MKAKIIITPKKAVLDPQGKTVQTALELGVPVNGIAESVFARALASHDDLRAAATNLAGPHRPLQGPGKAAFIQDAPQASWASTAVASASAPVSMSA